jgi:hypothetical protein
MDLGRGVSEGYIEIELVVLWKFYKECAVRGWWVYGGDGC